MIGLITDLFIVFELQ